MSYVRVLLCLVCVLLIAGPKEGAAQSLDVSEFAEDELPTGIQFDGQFLQAKRWQDENGVHVFFAYQREGDNTKYGVNNVELFAKQVTIGPEKRVVWDVYDYVRDCENLDHSLQLDTSATSITDLDSDDVAETTLVYEKFCGGGIAASDLKVLMMEGDEKYGLRGKTFAPLVEGVEVDLDAFEFNLSKATSGDSEPRTFPNQSVENGRYETAEDFADAPSVFLEFARKTWKETVRP